MAFSRPRQKSKTAVKSCSGLGLRIIKIHLKNKASLAKKAKIFYHRLQIPTWRIPWTEETDGLQSMVQRVGHD